MTIERNNKFIAAAAVCAWLGVSAAHADEPSSDPALLKGIVKTCVIQARKEVPPIPYFDAYLATDGVHEAPATNGNVMTAFAFRKCLDESGQFGPVPPKQTATK